MNNITRGVPIVAAMLVVIGLFTLPDAAAAKDSPSAMMAPIYAFATGDGSTNAAQLKAACVPDATIIDEFAPSSLAFEH